MIPYLPSSISLDTLPLAICQSHTACRQLVHQNTPANIQHHFPKKYVLISSNTLCRDFGASLTYIPPFQLNLLKQPSHFLSQHRFRMNFQIKCKETAPIPIKHRALCGLLCDRTEARKSIKDQMNASEERLFRRA